MKQLRYLTFWTPLRGEESVIGRSDYCSIPIGHPSVSRLHASITHQGERTFLRDLGSRNGTFLNGARVGDTPVPVEVGDIVRVGSVECVLEDSRENPQATADDSSVELWDGARPS